jgi:4-hydroxythreonine-4-phosphate dehydrogenase
VRSIDKRQNRIMSIKPTIGITIGDMNGIGLEVALKTLSAPKILDMCTPIIYGSAKVVSYHKNIIGENDLNFHNIRPGDRPHPGKINVVNCWDDNVNITLGKATEEGGKYAQLSLEAAVEDIKKRQVDAIVTGPIHKKAMQMAGFPHPGHTEYLTQHLGRNDQSLMLMASDSLRIGLITNHLPLKEVAAGISKNLILDKIQLLHDTLRIDFSIERPVIAVLGLNPHAGDDGVIGLEEEQIIRPAVVERKKNGILVMGPYPADGFFASGQYTKFDGILAMYHDQGLVPFKALAFDGGVNFTAGLAGIRTSPDHGTAYDIAGQNLANPASFRSALFLAIDIARNRHEFFDARKNALVQREKQLEDPNSGIEMLDED